MLEKFLGLRSMTSTIVQIDDELEDASKACGAGFLATFRVLIPLMMPGFITRLDSVGDYLSEGIQHLGLPLLPRSRADRTLALQFLHRR